MLKAIALAGLMMLGASFAATAEPTSTDTSPGYQDICDATGCCYTDGAYFCCCLYATNTCYCE